MPDPKPKILFVDDEESILRGVKLNLGRTYDISTASSGRDALSLLEEEEPFQVIVSDFAMPGMNGADFLEKVREQDKEVVTLLLTGQANFDDLCEVVRRGEIFRLLGKPCPPEILSRNLEQALKQYALIRSEKELLEKPSMAPLLPCPRFWPVRCLFFMAGPSGSKNYLWTHPGK